MKPRCQDGRRRLLDGLLAIVVLMVTLLSAEAWGTTYYLSPQGSDSGSGTSSGSPWKTFGFAIPKLSPGDTLILANGTYDGGTSGYPNIRCDIDANNGTATQQITVKAQNERQAFIKGTGFESGMLIVGCEYWTFQGLRIASADVPNSVEGQPIKALNSSHLIFRRLLLSHDNRYVNASIMQLTGVNNTLVEENELYSYHRHGIIVNYGENNIIRRNYANSRLHPDLPGGRFSGNPDRGDVGIAFYPGANNIAENNIVENMGAFCEINATAPTINNKFLGNISLNNHYGAVLRSRGNTLTLMPRDTLLENHVALNSSYFGGIFRATKNTQCNNCTALNNGHGLLNGENFGNGSGFAADLNGGDHVGDGNPTFFSTNSLAVNNGVYGFLMQNPVDYHISHSNVFGNPTPFAPATPSKLTNNLSVDPGLGSCQVFIPDNSPMKDAGKNGADVGANILYRYQDGVLTSTPLWNVSTGEFTCGAQVAGVNDIAGTSCFDVHKRLNVNTNGCSFPTGYGTGAAPPNNERPLPPTNLRVL